MRAEPFDVRIPKLFLVLAMAFGLIATAFVPAAHADDAFSDVPDDHPFHDEISFVADEGIAEGFSDGEYKTVRPVSRQAMVAFLHRVEGAPAGPFEDPGFSDVDEDHPFYDEIAWAVEVGVAQGFGDGTFRPTVAVSRQATSAFMYRLAGAPQLPGEEEWTNDFSDVDEDHPFYTEISWMSAVGIAEGFSDGEFKTVRPVSRQAMAAFIMRYIQRPPPFANVMGEVTNEETGAPIEDATVIVQRDGQDEFRGIATDEAGEYELLRLVPDTYEISVSADGFGDEQRTVFLDFGDNIEDFELTATPVDDPTTGSISGTVTGSDTEAGIEDALVVITDSDGSFSGKFTGADGTYEFLNLEPDTYDVSVSADGYESDSDTVLVLPGQDTDASFELDALDGTVSGTVTDTDGAAIEDATVTFFDEEMDTEAVATDEDGNYTIDLAAGEYTITVDADDFDSAEGAVTVTRDGEHEVNFELTRQATIVSIEVDTSDRTAVPGGEDGNVHPGDEWILTFSEDIDTDTDGVTIDLTDDDGMAFTVECVDDLDAVLDASTNAATCDVDGDVLTVELVEVPFGLGELTADYPLTIEDLVGVVTAEGGSIDLDNSVTEIALTS